MIALLLIGRDFMAFGILGMGVKELGTWLILFGASIMAGTCTFTPFKKGGPVAVVLENRVKGAFGVAVVPNVIRRLYVLSRRLYLEACLPVLGIAMASFSLFSPNMVLNQGAICSASQRRYGVYA
jgi:hypothetical protein